MNWKMTMKRFSSVIINIACEDDLYRPLSHPVSMFWTSFQISLPVCPPAVARALQRALIIMLEQEPSCPHIQWLWPRRTGDLCSVPGYWWSMCDWWILSHVRIFCMWCFLTEAIGCECCISLQQWVSNPVTSLQYFLPESVGAVTVYAKAHQCID
jgi:hypothetical protein